MHEIILASLLSMIYYLVPCILAKLAVQYPLFVAIYLIFIFMHRQVEARIVVLAVLRMIKENYTIGVDNISLETSIYEMQNGLFKQ